MMDERKKNNIIKNLVGISIMLWFLVAPLFSLAAEMSIVDGFDKIQEALELMARQNRLNIPDGPGASQLQSDLEKNLSKSILELKDLKQKLTDAQKFIDLGKQAQGSGSGSSDIFKQMQGLLGNASGLKGLSSTDKILGDYLKLGEMGNNGFKEAAGAVTQGLSGLGDLNTKISSLDGKVSEIGEMLPELESGIVGGSGTSGANSIGDLKDQFGKATGQADELASGLGEDAGNAFDTDKMQEGFDQPGTSKKTQGEESVCDKRPAEVTGEGNGNGVPTIEQEGPLLDLTGKLVEFTSAIKTINQETCYKIEQLYKKEFEYDKKTTEEARKKMDKIKKEVEKQNNEGRKPSNDLSAKESHWPTAEKIVREETQTGANYSVVLYDQSGIEDKIGIPLKEALTKQNENEKTDESAYKARTQPTFDTKSFVENARDKDNTEYFNGLTQIANPKNNAYGQVLIQSAERENLKQQFADRAMDKIISGQGIVGQEECIKTIEAPDGKQNCVEWKIKVPAKLYGDLSSKYFTDNYQQTANVDDISKVGDIESNKEDPQALDGNPEGSGGNSGGIPDGGSGSTGGVGGGITGGSGNIADVFPGGSGEFDWQQFLQWIQGTQTQEEQTEPVEPTAPNITINISNAIETNRTNGVKSTRVSWKTTNATECTASNDWLTYAEDATTTPKIKIARSAKLALTDSVIIDHPLPFSFTVNAYGINQIINSTQTRTLTLSQDGTGVKETVVYEPNLANLLEDSLIQISINKQFVSIPAGNEDLDVISKSDIVNRIKNEMTNVAPGTLKHFELSKIDKTVDGNRLILSRTVNDFSPNTLYVSASGDYGISCKGAGGTSLNSKTTIDFTK